MNNELQKYRDAEIALDRERRLMNEALARLQPKPVKHGGGKGRLIFALDLTGSREHSLKQSRVAIAAMFNAIKALGAVAIKLVYFRGAHCKCTGWHNDPAALAQTMRRLSTETGATQISRVLRLAVNEPETICGVVFVGDHCEDDPGDLYPLAQDLGEKSAPLFIFHECADGDKASLESKPVFKRMAELSGGVYVEFKPDSGAVLREMLSSVGAFAAAGVEGVSRVAAPQTSEARQLQGQLRLLGPGATP